jgi:hypothetical protein
MVFIQIDNPCFVVSEFSKTLFQSHLQKKIEFSYLMQVTSGVWLCSVPSAWARTRRHDGLADCCRLQHGCRVRGSRLALWISRPARVLFLFCPSDLKTKAVPAPGMLWVFKQGCAAVSKISVSTMQCCHWQHATTVSWYPTEQSPCISFDWQLLDFRYFEINGTNFTLRN